MKIQRFKNFNEKYITFDDEIVYAGRSKYPVGTKIKFKDEDEYLTGVLTHPFGFCQGADVGVYVDQKGVYVDDKICLKNREYIVIDTNDVDKFVKDFKFKKDIKKFNV